MIQKQRNQQTNNKEHATNNKTTNNQINKQRTKQATINKQEPSIIKQQTTCKQTSHIN